MDTTLSKSLQSTQLLSQNLKPLLQQRLLQQREMLHQDPVNHTRLALQKKSILKPLIKEELKHKVEFLSDSDIIDY